MAQINTTRFIILGLLSHEAMSGYDMKKRIELSVSHFWNVGFSQIYPTLAELEKDGHITKQSAEASKGPQRYVYAITDAGRQALTDWLLLPEEKEYTRYEILLKLFFGARLPKDVTCRRISSFRERYDGQREQMAAFKANLEQHMGQSPDHLNFYLTAMFGEYIYDAYVRWADEALRLLGSHQEV
jgi:DNA-binding PadR family transcriptional regulator